jgi:hypothetical protein
LLPEVNTPNVAGPTLADKEIAFFLAPPLERAPKPIVLQGTTKVTAVIRNDGVTRVDNGSGNKTVNGIDVKGAEDAKGALHMDSFIFLSEAEAVSSYPIALLA